MAVPRALPVDVDDGSRLPLVSSPSERVEDSIPKKVDGGGPVGVLPVVEVETKKRGKERTLKTRTEVSKCHRDQ